MEVALDERVPGDMHTDAFFSGSTSDPFVLNPTLNWLPLSFPAPDSSVGQFTLDPTFMPDATFSTVEPEIPSLPAPPSSPLSLPSTKRKPRRKPAKRPLSPNPPSRIHFVHPPPSSPTHPLPVALDVKLDGEAETRAANWPSEIPRSMLRAFRADPHRAFGTVTPRAPFRATGPLAGAESVLCVSKDALLEITPDEAERREGAWKREAAVAGLTAAETRGDAHIPTSFFPNITNNAAGRAVQPHSRPASSQDTSSATGAHILPFSVRGLRYNASEALATSTSHPPPTTEIHTERQPHPLQAAVSPPLRRSARKRKADENTAPQGVAPKQKKTREANDSSQAENQARRRGDRARKGGGGEKDNDIAGPSPLSPSRTQPSQCFSMSETRSDLRQERPMVLPVPTTGMNFESPVYGFPDGESTHYAHTRLHTAIWEQTSTDDMHSRTSTLSSTDSELVALSPPIDSVLHGEQSYRSFHDADGSGYIQQASVPCRAAHSLHHVSQHTVPFPRQHTTFRTVTPGPGPQHYYPIQPQSSFGHHSLDVHSSIPPSFHGSVYSDGRTVYPQPAPQLYHTPAYSSRTVPLAAPIPVPSSTPSAFAHSPFAQWPLQHPPMYHVPPYALTPPSAASTPAWSALFDTLKQGRPWDVPPARRGPCASFPIPVPGSEPAQGALPTPDAFPPLPVEQDPRGHRCPLCPRVFRLPNGLAIHLKWHWGATALEWKRGISKTSQAASRARAAAAAAAVEEAGAAEPEGPLASGSRAGGFVMPVIPYAMPGFGFRSPSVLRTPGRAALMSPSGSDGRWEEGLFGEEEPEDDNAASQDLISPSGRPDVGE